MDRDFIKKHWCITDSKGNDMMINCTKDDLNDILLSLKLENTRNEVFEYRSDEWWIYTEGDDYDVNKDYNKKD